MAFDAIGGDASEWVSHAIVREEIQKDKSLQSYTVP
jgi:hypothetical protein